MRYIQKNDQPPASIREWREVQEPVGVNLDYNSFTRKPALRAELIAEQFGLCAYTGAPLDERLGGYQATDQNLVFQAHIEHIKPRRVCQEELEARGGVYGYEICEDMDHRNLVAALEVRRQPPAQAEIFGAAAHGDELLPVTPVQPDCESRFQYGENGDISGADDDAKETIDLLKLDHTTLEGWRRGAIAGFFPPGEVLTREDVEKRISVLAAPTNGKLPEFNFCIRSYAESLI
jgi:uncharacterized protein (TIGR02646 family)